MLDDHFNHQAQRYVKPDYFTTKALGTVFRWLSNYYEEYQIACTDMPLRQYAQQSGNQVYSDEVEAIISLGFLVEDAFIKSQLKDFIRRNKFQQAFRDSQEIYNRGQHAEAYDAMARSMDEIYTVDFDSPNRTFFFESLNERQSRRYKAAINPLDGVYPTGFEEMDRAFNGGLHDGEVFMVLSYPKVGKTRWLAWQGFCAAFYTRVPVLHINLEGPRAQIEDRYESLFSGISYWDMRGGLDQDTYQRLQEDYQMLRKLLVIRSFDDFDITMLDVKAEVVELRTKGFDPRLLVLDYADMLRGRGKMDSEMAHQTAAVRDLKRFVSNRRMGCWTASQAQRPTKKRFVDREEILTANQIADSYAKIRIVDAYGSINQTETEYHADQFRIYWEGYRQGKLGKLFRLQNNQTTGGLGMWVEAMVIQKDPANEQSQEAS
jgi:replicative DNA helicase